MDLVTNRVDGKEILLKTFASVELLDDFSARVVPGNGRITVESDLTGLKGLKGSGCQDGVSFIE